MWVSTLSVGFYHILYLGRLGFTMPWASYFSIQDGVEFIKVQCNGSYFPYGPKISRSCKHFLIIQGCNGKHFASGTNLHRCRR